MTTQWRLHAPALEPGSPGAFDETAVKDPSVVFFDGLWHLFYTARGNKEYTTGYVAAPTLAALSTAPRYELTQVRGQRSRYGCAPQVFFFRPHQLWYLIFQSTDSNYQSMFTTTKTLGDPASWSDARPLAVKEDPAKEIDFWVLCDETTAYLYFTQAHHSVLVRQTALVDFPEGWGAATAVFQPVHEAVHVYRVQNRTAEGPAEFHMLYELNTGERSFGLASAPHPLGPWTDVTASYATGAQLIGESWADMVSHGEALRTGYDERLEYDADHPAFLIQGLKTAHYVDPYPEMPWKLGPMEREVLPDPGDKML